MHNVGISVDQLWQNDSQSTGTNWKYRRKERIWNLSPARSHIVTLAQKWGNCTLCTHIVIAAMQHGKMIPVTKWQHGHIVQHGTCDTWSADPSQLWQMRQGCGKNRDSGERGWAGSREIGKLTIRHHEKIFYFLILDTFTHCQTCIFPNSVIHRSTFTEWRDHASDDKLNRITHLAQSIDWSRN